jgi:hypothetical protein
VRARRCGDRHSAGRNQSARNGNAQNPFHRVVPSVSPLKRLHSRLFPCVARQERRAGANFAA